MPVYSSHAVISPMNNLEMGQEFLFNRENRDFGYLLPGGTFEEKDIEELEASGFKREKEISARVLIRGLSEDLRATTFDMTESVPCDYDKMLSDYSGAKLGAVLEIFYGWKPDDIRAKSGNAYHTDRMYFWGTTMFLGGTAIGLKPLSELKKHTKSDLRIMGIPEIRTEVLSPAIRKTVQQVPRMTRPAMEDRTFL